MKSKLVLAAIFAWLSFMQAYSQDAPRNASAGNAWNDSAYIRLSNNELIQAGRLSAVMRYADTVNSPITSYWVSFFWPEKNLRRDALGQSTDAFSRDLIAAIGKLEPGWIVIFEDIRTSTGKKMRPVKVMLK